MSINKLRKPRSEDEIKHFWTYTDKVYISCVCITYNQEIYIKDAIDSMLAQQTEYRFEIVIHDDCSTDDTRKILCEYKELYPSIIKLILQAENQYSQNPRIIPLVIPYLNGEFMTICEGDDFWIDECKIQKQIKHLSMFNNVNICFTAAKALYRDDRVKIISDLSNQKTVFTVEKVIQGGGGFIPTASIMLKTKILNDLPGWYYSAPVGDYFLQIYAAMPFGALFIPDETCVYRIGSDGSWSEKRNQMTIDDLYKEGETYECIFKQLIKCGIPEDIIFREISNRYLDLTMIATRNNYQDVTKSLIERSWFYFRKNNNKQILIYHLRNNYNLLNLFISLRKRIKDLTVVFFKK